jgi:LPXTG-site transpeptidase (sortase) family protein
MPRWLSTLILFLIFLVLVIPDPVRAGTYAGNAIQSIVIFVRSIGNEVDGVDTGGAQVRVVPDGAIDTGDGTIAAGDGITASTVSVTTSGFVAGAVLALALLRRWLRVGSPASIGRFSHQRGRTARRVHLTATGLSLALAAGCASPVSAVPSEVTGPSAVTAERVAQLPASAPTSLHIPAINVATELVELGLEADGSMEVPQSARLAGWYGLAPTPGELGPAVITGHTDWKYEVGIFHDLDKLKEGDELTVERKDGKAAVFRVVRVAQYPKERFPTRDVYSNVPYSALRIITCGGSFDPDASAYTHNVVVFARMIRSVDVPT